MAWTCSSSSLTDRAASHPSGRPVNWARATWSKLITATRDNQIKGMTLDDMSYVRITQEAGDCCSSVDLRRVAQHHQAAALEAPVAQHS